MARFEVPEGWTVQAFRFTLDPTEDQSWMLARHFGARRKAYNWTVATLKADLEAWRATGVETAKPSFGAEMSWRFQLSKGTAANPAMRGPISAARL
jgi:hypothetical protein